MRLCCITSAFNGVEIKGRKRKSRKRQKSGADVPPELKIAIT